MILIWKSLLVLAFGGITVAACINSPAYSSSLEAGINMDLPFFVGEYSGVEQEVSVAEKTILPPDTEFARKLYQTLNGDVMNCQIVLSGGSRRSIHQPEICLPGQGWVISNTEVIQIPLKNGGNLDTKLLTLTREVADAEGRRFTINSLFLYWFVGKDRTTPHHWQRIVLTSWDRIRHNISHRWGYVIVSATITEGLVRNGKNREETLAELKTFVSGIEPSLTKPTKQ